MNATDALDWFARLATVLGLPGVVIYLIRYRRAENAAARRAEAGADVDELTVPDKVRTSSIATLEAEMAAMQRAFDISRTTDAQTIARLSEQIQAERAASAEKDVRIRELESKVQTLQARVSEVSEELARVSDELRSLHDHEQGPGRP